MAKHDFHLDTTGQRDDWRLDSDMHNGPECRRCGDYILICCNPEDADEECDGLDRSVYVTVSVSYMPDGATTDDARTVIGHRVTISPEEMDEGDPVVRQLPRAVDEVREAWGRRER